MGTGEVRVVIETIDKATPILDAVALQLRTMMLRTQTKLWMFKHRVRL